MDDSKHRPDTGTRNNMIMGMAASILADKIEYWTLIAQQYEAKDQLGSGIEYRIRAQKAREALAFIDENVGCFS